MEKNTLKLRSKISTSIKKGNKNWYYLENLDLKLS
jgi:hypothetical protein